MKHSEFRRIVFALAVVGLLAGSFFAGRLAAGPELAQAQGKVIPASPTSPEASHYCYLNNVAAFDNRIHLRCTNDPGTTGIYYFSHPTGGSNGYIASRMLAVAQTAYALDKPVWVYYNSSSSYNPPGCNTGDCRFLYGVSMVNP